MERYDIYPDGFPKESKQLIEDLLEKRRIHREKIKNKLSEIDYDVLSKPPKYQPFLKETFPDNIKFIKDNHISRNLMEELFGEPLLKHYLPVTFTYIEINLEKLEWRVCFEYEWLYRNEPPLITFEELKKFL